MRALQITELTGPRSALKLVDAIAFISILSRRMKRLVTEEACS